MQVGTEGTACAGRQDGRLGGKGALQTWQQEMRLKTYTEDGSQVVAAANSVLKYGHFLDTRKFKDWLKKMSQCFMEQSFILIDSGDIHLKEVIYI